MNSFLITYGIGFIIFVLIGLLSGKARDYYKGLSNYGLFTTTSGLLASFVGAGSTINLIWLANEYGYWAYADVIPSVLGLLVAYVFVTKQSSNRFFYQTEYNNPLTLKVHHLVVVVLYTLIMVAQFIGLKKLAVIADVNNTTFLVAVTACLIWGYSLRGYSAVANTDKVQLVIMAFGFYLVAFFYTVFPDVPANADPPATKDMPFSLILALTLPFFFLPISQDVHQRASVAGNETIVKKSLLLAGVTYLVFGSITIFAAVNATSPGLEGIIAGMSPIMGNLLFFAILTAAISTTDTALNISAHSLSEVIQSKKLESRGFLLSLVTMLAAVTLSSVFPTILSVILLALFLYISGPAFMSLSKIYNLEERSALIISIIAVIGHLIIKGIGYEDTNFSLGVIACQVLVFFIIKRM